MTVFDFDTPIDRREVPALKHHPNVLGNAVGDLFAAGVADMDFRVAPAIRDALVNRLEHPVFGYEAVPDGLFPALQGWLDQRHGWVVSIDQILRAPNALNALAMAATLFSEPGDGIIVQPPVFFDFFDVIRENGRSVVSNPLILEDGQYRIDFDHFESLARQPANKILFLCSPHNPVGRVWTWDELQTLSAICNRHGVFVVADELHGDIVYPGHRFAPFATLGPEAAANCLSILSPAKTFNIASCCSAFSVIADDARRAALERENSRFTVNKNNAFSNVAMVAAYTQGRPWLDAVVDYLGGNLAVLRERIAGLPGVRMIEPGATFLVWLDFRALGLDPDKLHAFLRRDAGWALTRGVAFGPEGAGFMRLNIACPRARLDAALDDLAAALRGR